MNNLTGYIHNVSPVKHSNKTRYFDMLIQTEATKVRGVCFSSSKHLDFERCSKQKSPVKISNFTIKNDSVLMNARVQIEELKEVTFLREEIPSTLNISMLSNVTNNQLINLKAKVVHLSGVKKIITRDGTKSKADCCLLDPSGSIKLTLWEDLITEVADDNTYNFCNLKVTKDNDNYSIYLTTPKHDCSISPADPFQEEVASPGDLPDYFTQTSTNAEVLGVQNFMCYRQCCKCNKKLPATPGNVVKCETCGLRQKVSACSSQYHLQALLRHDDINTTVTFFNDTLLSALQLFKVDTKQSLSEDIVVEAFLNTPMLFVTFDKKTKVVAAVSVAEN